MAEHLIEVDERVIRWGVLLGLLRRADDGIHEFTETGAAWFKDWLREKEKGVA